MFLSQHLPATFKRARLTVHEEDDLCQRRAEAQFMIEPFTQAWALELGEDIAGHLFDEAKKIREELAHIDLRVRAGLQRVTIHRHEELRPLIVLDNVIAKDFAAIRIDDEKTNVSRLRFSFVLVFDLADKGARNFVIDEFGNALKLTFQSMQLPLPETDEQAAARAPKLRGIRGSRRTH